MKLSGSILVVVASCAAIVAAEDQHWWPWPQPKPWWSPYPVPRPHPVPHPRPGQGKPSPREYKLTHNYVPSNILDSFKFMSVSDGSMACFIID